MTSTVAMVRRLYLTRTITRREFHELQQHLLQVGDQAIGEIGRSECLRTLRIELKPEAAQIAQPLANVIFFLTSRGLLRESGVDNDRLAA